MVIWLLFIIAAGFSDPPAVDPAVLAKSPEWQRLLHYRTTLFGQPKSEIDSEGFFFAPDGKFNPAGELTASLEAFRKTQAQCDFPARYRFLKKHFALPDHSANCQDFKEWQAGLNAASVTLVFSSAYPNNPASMFGHTLLRLNPPKGAGGKPDLLAYGATFSATIGQEVDVVSYSFKGLFGFFQGAFSLSPYYQNVNEYNHSESRDLWEYDLNLTPEQMQVLVEHLWELHRKASLDYFFLDENCSYHLLSILEAANPSWDLSGRFYKVHRFHYVLPAATVRAVYEQPGAVGEVRFRPSSRKVLRQKFDMLTPSERRDFLSVIRHKREIEEIRDPFTLDAVVAYYDYRRYKEAAKITPATRSALRRSLVQRSKFDTKEVRSAPEFDKINRPDLIHAPHTLRGYGGWNETGNYFGLGLRLGLHDKLSSDAGYERHSHLEGLDFQGTYYPESGDWKITKATALDLLSLDVISPFTSDISYRFYAAYEPGLNADPQDANEFAMRGGVGYSLGWGSNVFYALALAAGGANPDVFRGYYLGPAAEAGWLGRLAPQLKFAFSLLWIKPLLPSAPEEDLYFTGEAGLSWIMARDFELRFRSLLRPAPQHRFHYEDDNSLHLLMHF